MWIGRLVLLSCYVRRGLGWLMVGRGGRGSPPSGSQRHQRTRNPGGGTRLARARFPEASDSAPLDGAFAELGVLPLLVSARSEVALRAQAQRLGARLREDPGLAPLDVAFSLASGRAQLERRAVVVGADRECLLAGLDALACGEPGRGW